MDLDGYQDNIKKIKELLLIGTSLTFFILLLERLTHIIIITLVPLLAILSVFLWTMYLKRVSKLKLEFKEYFMSDLPRMKNEMALFISAGFFGESIFHAGLSDHIISFIQYLGITQAFELSLFLYVSVILLSFIGIHPFVSVTTFSISFIGTDLLVRNEWIIAISLLSAWPITTTTSPFSGLVLYMSSLTSQSPFKVGLKQNWRYALFASISSLLIINLIHYL